MNIRLTAFRNENALNNDIPHMEFLELLEYKAYLENIGLRQKIVFYLHQSYPHSFRDGPLFFWRGGGMKNLEKNCLQNQKSPNKLFTGMKRRKKKFADQLIHSLICISKFSPIC